MWTVRATSSHMTAALTADAGILADGEGPVVAASARPASWMAAQGVHDAAADRVVPDQRERAHRDRRRRTRHAIMVSTQGISSPRAAQAVA